jgi:hypothetical protein
MKHTFRINLYGKGNTLYSGESLNQYQEYPLSIKSDGISENYLTTQRRLDFLIEQQASRWCLSISKLTDNENPVVAYGCLLPVKDEMNRLGVGFIHAIESNSDWSPENIVLAITKMLLPKNTNKMRQLISNIAIGNNALNDLTDYMASIYENQDSFDSSKLIQQLNNPIKEIRQDCGGAVTLAWLAMITSHSNDHSPWEIYEEYSHKTNIVSIISSSHEAVQELSLVSYLDEVVRNQKFITKSFYELQDNSEDYQVSALSIHQKESHAHRDDYHKISIYGLLKRLFLHLKKTLGMKDTKNSVYIKMNTISNIYQDISDIQNLLDKLSETYNSRHLSGQEKIIRHAIAKIRKDPHLQACVDNALGTYNTEDLSKAIDHPVAMKMIEIVKKGS